MRTPRTPINSAASRASFLEKLNSRTTALCRQMFITCRNARWYVVRSVIGLCILFSRFTSAVIAAP